jgi:hypothetical protein
MTVRTRWATDGSDGSGECITSRLMLAIGAVVGVELIIAPQSREDHLGRLEVCTEMGMAR